MRFLVFRTVGMPAQIVDRIRAAARKLGLTSQIPLVKLQRNPRREFYLFLGMKCDDQHELPPTFAEFRTLTRLGPPLAETLSRDQIAGFVGRSDIETHGLNTLAYQHPHRAEDPGDPFEAPDLPDRAEADSERDARTEHLLGWMSATGRGSWRTFTNACAALDLGNEAHTTRALLRQMVLLGHAELSPDGREWCVAPSIVVECAGDVTVHFLAGARTFRTTSGNNIICDPQPGSYGPPRARVGTEDPPSGCLTAGVASVNLASILPDLDGWKGALTRFDRVNAMIGRVERWNGLRFVDDSAFNDTPGAHQSPSGLYRLIRGDGETARSFIAFFDAPTGQWLRGDWHGLGFLAHQEQGVAVAGYDDERSRLLIPVSERWPLLYEKALVLASGLIPSRCGTRAQWLCYDSVPFELAHLLTEKLNVPLEKQRHA